jgi:hypothetical protein
MDPPSIIVLGPGISRQWVPARLRPDFGRPTGLVIVGAQATGFVETGAILKSANHRLLVPLPVVIPGINFPGSVIVIQGMLGQ